MTFGIIGPTISGNKGAAAMYEVAVQTLTEKYPGSKFYLFSYYPEADRKLLTFENVEIINASPKRLALFIVPLAFMYGVFKKFHIPVFPLRKIKQVKALSECDVILDEGGISFVDGREKYLIFNVAILLPGLFMGKKIIKCAQALGTFNNPINRLMAKIFLPRVDLTVARGKKTEEHLQELNLRNVVLGTDYAFSLRITDEDEKNVAKYLKHKAYNNRDRVVGLCPSTVIEDYCDKVGKDYIKITAEFVDYLTENDYTVSILPHSIRKNTEKRKNNDLPVCQKIFNEVQDQSKVLLVEDELNPRELRVLIGKCDLFVGSRFHSMISSLAMKVPTLVVGWSHKYKEVLGMFGADKYAFGHQKLTADFLISEFERLVKDKTEIQKLYTKNLPEVVKLSDKHVEYIDGVLSRTPGKFKLGKLNDATQDYYLGKFKSCRIGYSLQENIRKGAASGGIISTTLVHLLETGKIDGALVTRATVQDDKLGYDTFIATTPEEILSAQTSVYYDVPVLDKLDEVRNFKGKVAIVALPCQLRILNLMKKKDPELAKKVVFTIGMFCGHISKKKLVLDVLEKKKGIKESEIKEFRFRKGHWRGKTHVCLKNEERIKFPFSDYSTYQNLFFDTADRCVACYDHTAEYADMSCGDVWDYAYKKLGKKHNAVVARSKVAEDIVNEMLDAKKVLLPQVTPAKIFKAQSRSLIYHKHIKARAVLSKMLLGKQIKYSENEKARWNDYLAAWMILMNIRLAKSEIGRKFIFMLPTKLWYFYLVVFKGLTSF